MLIVKRPWDRQPPGRASIDPGHPLAKALQLAWVGNDLGGVDVFQGYRVPLLSGTTLGARAQGRAFTHTGTSGSVQAFPSEAQLPYVQVGYGYFNTAGGAWILSRLETAAGGYLSRLSLASSTTVALDIRWNFGTQRTLTVTLPTTLNTPICMAMVAYSSTDYRFFANGQQQNGTLSPGTFGSLDRMTPPGDTLNGGLWFTGFGSGVALDDAYLVKLTANPEQYLWSLFQRRIWVPVSAPAASGNTIAVPAGSLTLTGQTPTVTATANQAIAVPASSLSLTGFAPTVTVAANQTIAVPAGTLTLTGFTPTVTATANNQIEVPLGTLALTGNAPAVVTSGSNAIQVPTGTLTLTGNAPTVAVSANNQIAVPLGALSLAGFAPTVTVASGAQVIAVPLGTLTLTGRTPTVIASDGTDDPLDGFAANSRITTEFLASSRITTAVALRSPLRN